MEFSKTEFVIMLLKNILINFISQSSILYV